MDRENVTLLAQINKYATLFEGSRFKGWKSMKHFLFSVAALAFSFILSSCGGGGGGDSFVGAANVSVTVDPHEIDIADRTRVQIRVWDLSADGILLKVRFPDGLSYVPESAVLKAGRVEEELTPAFLQADRNYVYIVFFLDQSDFGPRGTSTGTVTFQLKGVENVSKGSVQADADVNDENIPDPQEFNIDDPQFEVQSSDDITVRTHQQ